MKIICTNGAGRMEFLHPLLDNLIYGMAILKENNLLPKDIELTKKEFDALYVELKSRGMVFKDDPKVTENKLFGLPVVIKP